MTTAAGRYLGWVLGIAVCGTIAVNPRASAFMLQSRVGTGAGFYRPSFAAGVSTPAGTRPVFFRRNRARCFHQRRTPSPPSTTTMAAAATTTTPLPGNVLVISGNRGLGLEVVRHLKTRESNIIATTRKTNADLEAVGVSVIEDIDVTAEDSGEKLVAAVRERLGEGGSLDYVICNAGILTPDTFEDPKYKACVTMYEVCVLGPLRAIQSLAMSGLLREGSKVGMVTSEGGSIGLRTELEGGNNYGHHMSKCAQNMLGKLLALDMKPRGIAICNLHPGFMKTSMTKIYADKYEELGAIGPEEAAPGIVKAVEMLTLETTGRFIAPQGSKSLGLGLYALDDPDSYGPFSELPW